MMRKTWREICKPIIKEVLERTKTFPESERKKELFKAYPFGERSRHPYKIWLDEIKIQTGKKKGIPREEVIDPAQNSLF